MNPVINNPYRILGLHNPVLSNTLQSRIAELRTNPEQASYPLDLSNVIKLDRSADSIADSLGRLNTPEERLSYAMFWFYQDGVDSDAGFRLLEKGQVAEAMGYWQNIITTKGANIANLINFNVSGIARLYANGYDGNLFSLIVDNYRLILSHYLGNLESQMLILDADKQKIVQAVANNLALVGQSFGLVGVALQNKLGDFYHLKGDDSTPPPFNPAPSNTATPKPNTPTPPDKDTDASLKELTANAIFSLDDAERRTDRLHELLPQIPSSQERVEKFSGVVVFILNYLIGQSNKATGLNFTGAPEQIATISKCKQIADRLSLLEMADHVRRSLDDYKNTLTQTSTPANTGGAPYGASSQNNNDSSLVPIMLGLVVVALGVGIWSLYKFKNDLLGASPVTSLSDKASAAETVTKKPADIRTCPVYNTWGGGYVQLRKSCGTKNCITDHSTYGETLDDYTTIAVDFNNGVTHTGGGMTISYLRLVDLKDTWISDSRIIKDQCTKGNTAENIQDAINGGVYEDYTENYPLRTCPVFNPHGGGYVQLREGCSVANCATSNSTLGGTLDDYTQIVIDPNQTIRHGDIDFVKLADLPDTWISSNRLVYADCVDGSHATNTKGTRRQATGPAYNQDHEEYDEYEENYEGEEAESAAAHETSDDFFSNNSGTYTCPVFNPHGGGYVQLREGCGSNNCATDDSTLGATLDDGETVTFDTNDTVTHPNNSGGTVTFVRLTDYNDTWLSTGRIDTNQCVGQ